MAIAAIADLLELFVVEHVIPTIFAGDCPNRRVRTFLRALESMDDTLARGRPFVASDGC